MPVIDILQSALTLHRRGAVEEAAARYREVLTADPANVDARYYLAMISCQRGDFAEGVALANKALADDPRHTRAHVLLGRALSALGRRAEALQSFDHAIAVAPELAEAHSNRADVLSELGRNTEAVESYDRALALAPDSLENWFNRGMTLGDLGRHSEAVTSFNRAIAGKADFAEAYVGRARSLFDLDRHAESLESADAALALAPNLAEAWISRGNILLALNRTGEALAAHDRALALNSGLAAAWLGRGYACTTLDRPQDAMVACERALGLKPDFAEAWLGYGNALTKLERTHDALDAYDRALSLKPGLATAWLGRGNELFDLKRFDDASNAFDEALALKPDLAEAWLGRGNVLTELVRYDEALAAYDKALALKPDLAEAWLGRGNALAQLTRYDDALLAYDRALASKPGLAHVWLGRGNVFTELNKSDEAFAAYDRAMALNVELREAPGARLHSKLQLCGWSNLDTEMEQVLSMIRQNKPASIPFYLLAFNSSSADQLQCARRYVQDRPSYPKITRGRVYAHDRIRVAYLSGDFHDHPVAQLTAGLFEHHDRTRFATTAISFGPDRNSPMRQRLKAAFERFVDAQYRTESEIADLIHRLEIDIAIDLMGFTAHNRFGALARRPAPVQVNYLGYSGTMGADCIDYIIADATAIPEDRRAFYAEQVIWLPDSFLVYDDRRVVTARTPARRECGLPEGAFVFCCFNNSYKIGPEVFTVWMKLLKTIDNSVLWLSELPAMAQANLRREAQRRGVQAERLIFAPRLPDVADHLARQRQADLFLDTLPYNAHTTAADALWAGIPVLTCCGATFAGRVAASLLKAIGLGELIADSLEDYETRARKLARDPPYLAMLKEKLGRNRTTFPLFDTGRFTRNLERAYTAMWERHRSGQKPQGFAVEP
jgi:protein O-GlcNAc transferase